MKTKGRGRTENATGFKRNDRVERGICVIK